MWILVCHRGMVRCSSYPTRDSGDSGFIMIHHDSSWFIMIRIPDRMTNGWPSIHPSIFHISYTNPSIHISYSIIYHALTLAHVTHFAIPKQITEICPSELLLFRVRELCPGTSWRVASLAWEKTRAIKNQKMSGFQLKHAGFHAAYAAWVWWAVLHVLWKEIPPKTSNWSTGKDPKGMS